MLEIFIRYYWYEHGTFVGIENSRFGSQIVMDAGSSDKKVVRGYCAKKLFGLEAKKLITEKPTKPCIENTSQVLLLANTVLTTELPFKLDDDEVTLYDLFLACTSKKVRASTDNKILSNMKLTLFDKYVETLAKLYCVVPESKNNEVAVDFEVAKTKVVNLSIHEESVESTRANAVKLICELARAVKKYGGVSSDLYMALIEGKATYLVEKAFSLGITVNQFLAIADASIPDFMRSSEQPCSFECNDGFTITVSPDSTVVKEDVCDVAARRIKRLEEVKAFGC